MKKILFLTTFCVVLIMHSSAWSAALTLEHVDLGTISGNYSWSTDNLNVDPQGNYKLTFTVAKNNVVDFNINMKSTQTIWVFNEDKTFSSYTGEDAWMWTKQFCQGSYTLAIYGKTQNDFMVLSSPIATPLPGAVLFLGSGILGLFSIRRKNYLFRKLSTT